MTSLRTRYLSDDDAARLYAGHPELGRSPDTYCPTCFKKGVFRWKGRDYPCDCEMQLQLHKHYLHAGIGVIYQRLDWDDLKDDNLREVVKSYADNQEFVRRGRGLVFSGGLGTGKTLAATLALKKFVRDGFSGFATCFSEMIDLYTAGWYSEEERAYFHRRVVDPQVLLIDDVGKEHKRKNALSQTILDNVVRTRTQHGRAMLVTTNLSETELGEVYGSAVMRLLRESCMAIGVEGEDYSIKAAERVNAEMGAGEVRPIV